VGIYLAHIIINKVKSMKGGSKKGNNWEEREKEKNQKMGLKEVAIVQRRMKRPKKMKRKMTINLIKYEQFYILYIFI
jgi:hypothetical protein